MLDYLLFTIQIVNISISLLQTENNNRTPSRVDAPDKISLGVVKKLEYEFVFKNVFVLTLFVMCASFFSHITNAHYEK